MIHNSKKLLNNPPKEKGFKFLDDTDVDDWRLCSAYIDWVISAAFRIDYILDESVSIAFSVLDSFINIFEKKPSSSFVRDFQKLLIILSLRKWQSMGGPLSTINIEELEKDFWIKPY